MRILHVLDHSIPLQSGYTFRTRAILDQQHKLDWETFHITGVKHGQTDTDKETVDGLEFYRTTQSDSFLYKLPVVHQYATILDLEKRLYEIAQKIKPNIIHAHSPSLNGVAALRVGKKLNIPVVYEIRAFWEDAAVDHGTTTEGSLRYRITRAIETYVANKAGHVTCICDGLKQDLISRGISESKITLIPNAIHPDKFEFDQPANQQLKEGLKLNDKTILGFIGSFYAYEGIDLVIDALDTIKQKIPNIHLLLVGGGPQEDNLKRKVKDLQLDDIVTFTSRVPHSEVQKYYNLVDILVYARHKMRLTDLVTPLKPLEAMAQGKIFIASDVGGHKELIEDGVNGTLFKAEDKNSLIAAIEKLINNKDNWQQIKTNGRKFVEEVRCWENSVANYDGIYSSLASAE
ncbi:MAG: glycosyltransferase, exosortase A system-associated [Gammaproteobacteria bacterium]|nr:MAG: glycosyltransferase, exosortase A system-associated [Gammaproteobacteria bacterium]